MTITANALVATTRTAQPALGRIAVVAGITAAAATAVVAGTADAAGVSLDIDGEPVPLLGFANLTLICVALGYVLALAVRRWAVRPRRTFVALTIGLVVLSFVPDLFVPNTAAGTRFLLMTTHIVAAAIVIPAIASRLPERRR